MKKRGQFYLLAAFVIIGIVSGLATIYTSARTPREDFTIKYLTDEMKYESYQTINNAKYTGVDIKTNLNTLADSYKTTNPNHDFIAVYDDSAETTFFPRFSNDSTTITTTLEDGSVRSIPLEPQTSFSSTGSGQIILESNGEKIIFETKEEPTFNIVVQKKEGEEIFLATSPPDEE